MDSRYQLFFDYCLSYRPTNELTISEIEAAINLGGKTKCFIFILQSLNLIKKVAGTDMYQICDQ